MTGPPTSAAMERLPEPCDAAGQRGRIESRVMFLIRSLDLGGAERQLVTLARALKARGRAVVVVTFYPGGPLERDLEEAGVALRTLDKTGRWEVIGFLRRLLRVVREERPGVLHGYLTVANLLAAILHPLFPGMRIIWGVRDSDMDLQQYDWTERLTSAVERKLSSAADLILANSWAGREYRCARGFPPERMRVIANGIDVDRFRPDGARGQEQRAAWGVAPTEPLVGLVGRLDPMKDHPTFLRAAALVARTRPDVRFVCVGGGAAGSDAPLRDLASDLGLDARLHWAGALGDMPAVYNALDLACSSSAFGEGFANVLGEAMACGVPCVVTDVGDSARIVDATGIVVPPRDPEALATAMLRALGREPAEQAELRRSARERIVEHFSVERLVLETEDALWPTG